MKNIIVTDYNETGENIIIFCDELTPELLTKFFEIKKVPFTDVSEVRQDELQYYLYEPIWFQEKQEREVIRLVTESEAKSLKEIEFTIHSPDGFSIYCETYKAPGTNYLVSIKEIFDEWKRRYTRQGYYSSNTGRIQLDELHKHCTFIQITPDPEEKPLPIHKKNLSFL